MNGDGIVFVLARWSPDAVMRWDELQDELARAGYRGRVELVDPEAPSFDPAAFAQRFGLTVHGWGEAFVVERGAVVLRSSAEEGCSLAQIAQRASR